MNPDRFQDPSIEDRLKIIEDHLDINTTNEHWKRAGEELAERYGGEVLAADGFGVRIRFDDAGFGQCIDYLECNDIEHSIQATPNGAVVSV